MASKALDSVVCYFCVYFRTRWEATHSLQAHCDGSQAQRRQRMYVTRLVHAVRRVLLYVAHPVTDVRERRIVCDIIHQQDAHGAPVVGCAATFQSATWDHCSQPEWSGFAGSKQRPHKTAEAFTGSGNAAHILLQRESAGGGKQAGKG